MQAAGITHGIETTAAALVDGDDNGEGGDEGLGKRESLTGNEELEKVVGASDQRKAVSMDFQQGEANIGAFTVSGECKGLPDKLAGFEEQLDALRINNGTMDGLTFPRKETIGALDNSESAYQQVHFHRIPHYANYVLK